MPTRWHTVPTILFALVSSSFAAKSQPFENTAIVRSVELGGSQVHVTTTYAVKALQAGSKVYSLALGPEERDKTSWLEVRLKGQQDFLPIEEHKFEGHECVSHAFFHSSLRLNLPQEISPSGRDFAKSTRS